MKGHRPRRRFGQHFLENELILERMVDVLALSRGDRVLEVGPGFGALTALLVRELDALTAVEIDRDIAAALEDRYSNLHLIVDDVLRVDLEGLFAGFDDWRVVGNLPYNISTPLLARLIEAVGAIRDVHVLLQAEVVDRLTAVPGTRDWGRLSIAAQLRWQVDALFDVGPENFRPPPKVNSRFVRLAPRPAAQLPRDARLFDEVVRLAFQQRRKTLRNALRALPVDWQRVPVAMTDRADAVDIAGYVSIADALSESAANTQTDPHAGPGPDEEYGP